MRRRDNNIPKNEKAELVQGWRKRLAAIDKEIQQEYVGYSSQDDRSSAVMYREYLVTAANFLQRADEMLAEHLEVIERNEAWEEAQRRLKC